MMKEGDVVELGGEEWTVVSVYTRAQALADGELVDVSAQAARDGIHYPAAVTRAVWAAIAAAGEAKTAARLHAVTWALRCAASRAKPRADRIWFTVTLDDRALDLWSVCGPGDDAEPVITVMFTDED